MLFSEPQLITQVSPVITYLKPLADFPEHGWDSRNERRHTARDSPAPPSRQLRPLRSVLPVRREGQQLTSDTAACRARALRKKLDLQAELDPLSSGSSPPHPAPPGHTDRTGQTAVNAQRVLSAHPHVPCLNTPSLGSSYHGHLHHLPKVLQKHLFKECKQSFTFWRGLIWKYHWN